MSRIHDTTLDFIASAFTDDDYKPLPADHLPEHFTCLFCGSPIDTDTGMHSCTVQPKQLSAGQRISNEHAEIFNEQFVWCADCGKAVEVTSLTSCSECGSFRTSLIENDSQVAESSKCVSNTALLSHFETETERGSY